MTIHYTVLGNTEEVMGKSEVMYYPIVNHVILRKGVMQFFLGFVFWLLCLIVLPFLNTPNPEVGHTV